MKKSALKKVVIIGCGNVAWHIASHLRKTGGYRISVYNHRPNPFLGKFKTSLKCTVNDSFADIEGDADLYFICVTDHAIVSSAEKIFARKPGALLMHTSGSAGLNLLGKRIHATGVFYPLQTFSAGVPADWSDTPVIVEAVGISAMKKIRQTASVFSNKVVAMNDPQRTRMHLAAVFVNNFTNSLYAAASELSGSKENFDLLYPLIRRTVSKLEHMSPEAAQTGPAIRGDSAVQEKHLVLLSKKPLLKKIYKQMSRLITRQQKHP